MSKPYTHFIILLLSATLTTGCATNGSELPDTSEDGLKRVETKRIDSAYINPDADFSEFKRIAIADVDVAFRRNWLRDQNQESRGLGHRLSQQDADRIKTAIAGEFRRIFTEELEKGGYTVVGMDADNTERDILILRPDILDLDVVAPDTRSAGIHRSYTASAGSMTLSIEFQDAVSGTLLGRVTDRQKAPDYGYMRITNSVTNKAEADRILRKWARLLVSKLDSMK